MAKMRRTADNEPVPPPPEPARPEIVVTDPAPRPAFDQGWSLTSYPFYEPPPDDDSTPPRPPPEPAARPRRSRTKHGETS